jgi:hypothetical protein
MRSAICLSWLFVVLLSLFATTVIVLRVHSNAAIEEPIRASATGNEALERVGARSLRRAEAERHCYIVRVTRWIATRAIDRASDVL